LLFGIISYFYSLIHDGIFYTRDFYLLPFLLLAGKSVYYEAHYFPTNKIAIWLHKLLIPKLAGVVVITNAFVNHFKEFNYKKILVAHDATDITFFKPVPREPNKKIIIGYIGRLSGLGEDKGGNILIEAFKKAYSKNRNIELSIVGEQQKEKIPGVTFAGTRPYNEMPYYFNLIDIAVIPFPDRPHFRYFMSPLKLFDYLAVGKPIITSDLPSIREVLTEDSAVFCQPGDSDSLAGGMEKLINDKNMRLKMAENNKFLAKKYTWELRVKKILDFIY
ncbi:MAG: glycosyltransferase, partial [Patescibacteria group bacterium]